METFVYMVSSIYTIFNLSEKCNNIIYFIFSYHLVKTRIRGYIYLDINCILSEIP